jgi:hypothetical protein
MFPGLVLFFEPSEEVREIGFDIAKAWASFFEGLELLRHVDCIRAEVIEVSRYESTLLVPLEIILGLLGLLRFESRISIEVATGRSLIHTHGVHELSVAGASLARPAGTYDPIIYLRQFNDVLVTLLAQRFFSHLAEFAAAQGTRTEIGVRFMAVIMLNNIGENFQCRPCIGSCASSYTDQHPQ